MHKLQRHTQRLTLKNILRKARIVIKHINFVYKYLLNDFICEYFRIYLSHAENVS